MRGLMILANYFEDIEALGTLDLIRRAHIDIDTVSVTGKKEVVTQSNVVMHCDKMIEEVNLDDYSFVILPGGKAVMMTHLQNEVTEQIISYFYKKELLIACICAAPSVLGKLDLLQGVSFTCFPSFEKFCEGALYLQDCDVVVDKNIITSKACGTTFKFAYEIIKYLKGESIARHIMETVFYKIS